MDYSYIDTSKQHTENAKKKGLSRTVCKGHILRRMPIGLVNGLPVGLPCHMDRQSLDTVAQLHEATARSKHYFPHRPKRLARTSHFNRKTGRLLLQQTVLLKPTRNATRKSICPVGVMSEIDLCGRLKGDVIHDKIGWTVLRRPFRGAGQLRNEAAGMRYCQRQILRANKGEGAEGYLLSILTGGGLCLSYGTTKGSQQKSFFMVRPTNLMSRINGKKTHTQAKVCSIFLPGTN